MAQININIRMDEELKRDFENVCNEMGLTMTTAFTVFAKAVSARKEIPFKIAAQLPPVPGAKTPKPDCMAGRIWQADDFDADLDDFKEYME
jgi:addiction module RelB/DinJ family antitoxin